MSYERPADLARALALRAEGGRVVLAGGTDLLAATRARELRGPVLDVTGVAEMQGVTLSAEGLRLGGAASWTAVARAPLPPACAGLQAAARVVGSTQIQNRGTVAGNLVNASPAADSVPPLLTLDAEVELVSLRGTRRLALGAFLLGPRRTALAADELLVAVHVPAAALAGQGAFEKLGARAHLVISIGMAAARLVVAGGRVVSAALAVGACSPVAQRLGAVEAALVGRPLAELGEALDPAAAAAALSPIDDVRADAGYRRAVAPELLRRALLACAPAPETAL
ncbi:FAD binding domain-containing protein [Albimonas pacifica]|uniref:CO or xanthine dehydrogenase, FAD-binding subunit n=1 Tax=Albimonas pacifica TaxID=1114924 RepID=A0A1I3BFX3_9RHOB|nr:FAD binding domain-containing protein [Albimonas pacifica]SFH61183.1 CO or xanthine dehydrogenase, FAD-binding subunit [Albimonas pacifica]